MFVQMIQGKTADREGFYRQAQRWRDELQAGAPGFLGTTMGVAADGSVFVLARFVDEDAARRNEQRSEQAQWWTETEKYFTDAPTFAESTDVESFLDGGSDAARFVQVISATTPDRNRLSELDRTMETHLRQLRPDVIGGLRIWTGDRSFTEVVYFTSEAEARQGEQREVPDAAKAQLQEWESLLQQPAYLDLPDPLLH